MEKLSHSHHRRQSSTSSLSKSMLKLHSFTRSSVYDDLLTNHPIHGGPKVSSPVEDYSEMFNSPRASSIPFLDLPPLDKDRSYRVDYSNIFGALNDGDVCITYHQLFTKTKGEACFSKNARSPEDPPSFADSDQFSLDQREEMSYESVHQSEKQFSVSYLRSSQEGRNGVNGTTHIAHLHAVPGFTCIIDETISSQRTNSKKEEPIQAPLGCEEATVEDPMKAASSSFFSEKASVKTDDLQEEHPFESPLEVPISSKTQKVDTDGNSCDHSTSPNMVLETRDDPVSCSAPCSDNDIDANSEAAASAAALRKAIKEAQVKIRVVKQFMRRKNEGSEGSIKAKFKDLIKSRNERSNATEREVLWKSRNVVSAENEFKEIKSFESFDDVMQTLKDNWLSFNITKYEQPKDTTVNKKLSDEVNEEEKIEEKNDTVETDPLIVKFNEEKKMKEVHCSMYGFQREPIPGLHEEKRIEEGEDTLLSDEVNEEEKNEETNDTVETDPLIIEFHEDKKIEEIHYSMDEFQRELILELHEEKRIEGREDASRAEHEDEEQKSLRESKMEQFPTTEITVEPESVQGCKIEQFRSPIESSGEPILIEDKNANVNSTSPAVVTVHDQDKDFEEFMETGELMEELDCEESEKDGEEILGKPKCFENSDDATFFEEDESRNSFHDCEGDLEVPQLDESTTFSFDNSENLDRLLNPSSDDMYNEPLKVSELAEVALEHLTSDDVIEDDNDNVLEEQSTSEEMDDTLSKEEEVRDCSHDYEDNLGISEVDETTMLSHEDSGNMDGMSNPSNIKQLEEVQPSVVTPESLSSEAAPEKDNDNLPAENPILEEMDAREALQKENCSEEENQRKIEEERMRRRQMEKDREAVGRAIREARERAFKEARERAAVQRATTEVQKRTVAEAQASAKKNLISVIEAKIKAERAAVERATAEARQRALQKAMSGKFASQVGEPGGAARNISSAHGPQPSDPSTSSAYSHPFSHKGSSGAKVESKLRVRARLERHQRTAERAAKALAEKDMRDLLAQREQAERNRLAETLDADVKRWSSGKHGNLRALLSTLQYILGPGSSWQPIPLTDIVTSSGARKAYRKATLCVHPDKLQQRGAGIQQKYICEKVFDLLKDAWNKFNSEER